MKNDGDLALDAGRIRERWHTGKKGIVVVGGLLYVSSKMRGGTQVVWFSKLDALPDSGHRGGTGGEISRSGTENSGWLVGGPRGRRKAGLSLPFESSSAFVGHSDRASLALLSFVEAGCEKQDLGNEARRGGENEWLGGGGEVGADSPWQRGVVGRFEGEAPAAPVGCYGWAGAPGRGCEINKRVQTKPTHNKMARS